MHDEPVSIVSIMCRSVDPVGCDEMSKFAERNLRADVWLCLVAAHGAAVR